MQVRKIICDWLARLLCMKRPQSSDAGANSMLAGSLSSSGPGPSTSDRDRRLRAAANGGVVGVATKVTCSPRGAVVVSPVSTDASPPPLDHLDPTRTFDDSRYRGQETSGDEAMPPTYDDLLNTSPDYEPDRDPAAASSSTSNVEMESSGGGINMESREDRLSSAALSAVLHELRLLTGKLRDDDTRLATCSDWKFAAMVVDRFCLILFSVFTVVSTFAILFSAPHGMA